MKKFHVFIAVFIFIALILITPMMLYAGAKHEEAAPARGKYLAERGIIVPPEEVYIDSYISYIDYNYPKPDSELGITIYSGHRQISSRGQEEIVQIGIQGGDVRLDELPPMNLSFVVDKSSSMRKQEKIYWVKESFDVFIDRVRDKDFVSLIFFDSSIKVVFPSALMNSENRKELFKRKVSNIRPCGSTDLTAGLERGYQEILANFHEGYINRLVLITDGIGETEGLMEMAEKYRKLGINVSIVGVGTDINLALMRGLAQSSGGSSRFISDREEMKKIFGSEFERMAVPVARDLNMKLEFLQEVEITGTWGYDNRIEGNTIHYYMPTLHQSDYETILTQIRIPHHDMNGENNLARFSMTYKDLKGGSHSAGPYYLKINYVDYKSPVTGFTDGTVLRSGTMLHFAQVLKKIGELYYSSQKEKELIVQLIRDVSYSWEDTFEQWLSTSPRIKDLEHSYIKKIRAALDLAISARNELKNTRLRLDNEEFNDEIVILDRYIGIIGNELERAGVVTTEVIREVVQDEEIAPPVENRSLQEHVENLFLEITLDLGLKKTGTVAISGFTAKDERTHDLIALLNEMAVLEVSKHKTLTVIERDKMDMIIEEQKLALSDLMDTENAITIGKLLTATHILTGSVIEMPDSFIIFGRIINVETSEIESVAQVIVTKEKVLEALDLI